MQDNKTENQVVSLRMFSSWLIPFGLSGLQVVKQCCATDGVEPQYIKDEILPDFFKHFWQHRMALDRRNYRQVSQVHDMYALCSNCIKSKLARVV